MNYLLLCFQGLKKMSNRLKLMDTRFLNFQRSFNHFFALKGQRSLNLKERRKKIKDKIKKESYLYPTPPPATPRQGSVSLV